MIDTRSRQDFFNLTARRAFACLLLLATTVATAKAQQPATMITETQARAWAIEAAKGRDGEPIQFENAFINLARSVSPDYHRSLGQSLVPIFVTDEIDVFLLSPALTFQGMAAERVRKMLPVGDVPWNPHVTIVVNPKRITAPNIERVVVRRNGNTIEPSETALVPTAMTSAMGATVTLPKGHLSFPPESFTPGGGDVLVTVIPSTGTNTTMTIPDAILRKIM